MSSPTPHKVDRSLAVYGGRDISYDSWYPIMTAITERTGLTAWFMQVGNFCDASPRHHMQYALTNYDEIRETTNNEVFVLGESYGAVLARHIASLRPLDGLVLCAPVMLPHDDKWRSWETIDSDREGLASFRRNSQRLRQHAGHTALMPLQRVAILSHSPDDRYSTPETRSEYKDLFKRNGLETATIEIPDVPHSTQQFSEAQQRRYGKELFELLSGWLASADDPVDFLDGGNAAEGLQEPVMQHR